MRYALNQEFHDWVLRLTFEAGPDGASVAQISERHPSLYFNGHPRSRSGVILGALKRLERAGVVYRVPQTWPVKWAALEPAFEPAFVVTDKGREYLAAEGLL